MEFPYTGWVLQPSFKPVETTFDSDFHHGKYHSSESGKIFHEDEIYKSKSEAISAGYERLKKQQADIDKKQGNINKRQATLDKFSE